MTLIKLSPRFPRPEDLEHEYPTGIFSATDSPTKEKSIIREDHREYL